jgi:hypothetical protein
MGAIGIVGNNKSRLSTGIIPYGDATLSPLVKPSSNNIFFEKDIQDENKKLVRKGS